MITIVIMLLMMITMMMTSSRKETAMTMVKMTGNKSIGVCVSCTPEQVEVIGDVYMVVSSVPVCTKNRDDDDNDDDDGTCPV